MSILEFEKPIYELEAKIEELKSFGDEKKISIEPEIKKLQEKLEKMKRQVYKSLSIWQRVQIARGDGQRNRQTRACITDGHHSRGIYRRRRHLIANCGRPERTSRAAP